MIVLLFGLVSSGISNAVTNDNSGTPIVATDDVRKAAPGFHFNYPVMVGSPEEMLDLMNALGNTQGGLPFSVVIGTDGKILQRQLGEFSAVELAGLIEEQLPTPH